MAEQERRSRARNVVDIVASLAMIVVSSVVGWAYLSKPRLEPPPVKPSMTIPVEPMSIQGLAAIGSTSAPVVFVMFSDFQCPYCEKFARDTYPLIRERYIDKGMVQAVFRHLPLPMHAVARQAAEAAACAGQQGHFWQIHDKFFAISRLLDLKLIDSTVRGENLDTRTFDKCMAGPGPKMVREDAYASSALNITGTPAFFIGQRLSEGTVKILSTVDGARPMQQFSAALDDAISRSPSKPH